ncbi:MAG: cytochrome c [Chloroflexi bacterium]|nr:cytochrome c [Chloroflexota bacterium]
MSRPVVPVLAFTLVLALALGLILGIILRPWVGLAAGTYLSVDAPSGTGYSRSALSYVGDSRSVNWGHSAQFLHPELEEGKAYYVAYGCASCHGLDGKGSRWAPMEVSSPGQIGIMVRAGPGGMPAYPKAYLPDEHLEAITSWLASQGAVVARPTPTPLPTPTPEPTPASPEPTPVPPSEGTPVVPSEEASPTPMPTPTPSPTPTPAAVAGDPERGLALYTQNKCSRCHGKAGAGTDLAPALDTAEFHDKFAQDGDLVRLLREGIGDMPGYDSTKLPEQGLADIIAYVRSLRPKP